MTTHRTTPATVRAAGAAVLAALTVVAILLTTSPAVAQPTTGDHAVAAFLAEHPEARKIGPNQVSWHGGDVVMTFPGHRVLSRLTSGCYAGWSCLYEHRDYGGRRLQFRNCGSTQSLGAYGFANMTTSWINRRSSASLVRDTATGGLLWTAPGNSSSRYVGSTVNDRADTIYLAC